jgi:hypothetical protein
MAAIERKASRDGLAHGEERVDCCIVSLSFPAPTREPATARIT